MTQDPLTPPQDAPASPGATPESARSEQASAAQSETAQAAEREARLKAAQARDAELREAQYTRKLSLAILSTLQHKGILSSTEVDQLLLAVKRATDASFTPSVAVRSEFQPQDVKNDPKRVRHEARPPPIFDIQID